jgi:hypothetical protein
MLKSDLARKLAGAPTEEPSTDNLATVLCTYFEGHPDRPDGDQDDEEAGWGEWVVMKCYIALNLIAREIKDK